MSVYNETHPLSGETESADVDDREEVSEEALRLALARLGSKRPATSQSPSPSTHQSAAAQPASRPSRGFEPAQRRRKFVQDGEVRVEHHAIARPSPRALHAPSEENAELERLRHLLRQEQKLREDAERACHDAQAGLRSMETRAGHADIVLAEAQAGIESRNEEILALKASLHAARADIARLEQQLARRPQPAPAPPPASAKVAPPKVAPGVAHGFAPAAMPAPLPRVGRPRRVVAQVEAPEPEPVKWWIKKK